MTKKKIKNNMSSSGLTRRSRNKDIHSTGFPVKRGMTKDLESGRSMVEMLGVLAVVGVLSVGGIAGYSYGMNKVRANEIVHTVSMMAVTASQGLMLNGDFSLDEYGNEISGYAFEYDTNHSKQDDDFSITVKGVDEGVCEQVMNFEWEIPYEVKVNGISYGECDDENDIVFVFTDDLGGIWEEMTYGACTEYACKSCHVSETLKCSSSGTGPSACICIPEDETGVCGWKSCISCPAGETPKCSTEGTRENACVCVPDGKTATCSSKGCIIHSKDEKATCGSYRCIVCSVDETPKCVNSNDESACACIPKGAVEGEDYACISAEICRACSENETIKCASNGTDEDACVCVAKDAVEGEDYICREYGCWSCLENETIQCASVGLGLNENSCICVPNGSVEGKDWLCGKETCISCSTGETPVCSDSRYKHACICVAEDETYTCNSYGCITHPEGETGVCAISDCISCPSGEIPKCASFGKGENGCLCQGPTEKSACSGYSCISCPADQTPKCSTNGTRENACVCVSSNEKFACGMNECIICPAEEEPQCSNGSCICVSKNENSACGKAGCISCPAGETPMCGDYECICCPAGETPMCGDYECICCSAGKTPMCKQGGCACFNEGEDGVCSGGVCKTCSDGKTAICPSLPSDESDCICIEEGEKYQCNNYSCISCPADKEAFCENKSCVCSNPEDVFKGSDGKNYACSTTSTVTSDESACSACNKTDYPRFYIDGKCYLDCRTSETPLISSTGSCYACDTASSITTDEAACSRCSELRTMENGKCVPKNCPVIDGEVYVKNRTGGCTKCSAAGIPYSDIGHLEVCKAAGYPRFTNAAGTVSYLCSQTKLGSSNAGVCHLCNYPGSPVPRFVGTDKYCYPCSESTSVATSPDECAQCGGLRIYDATTGKCSKAS